jgi:hypothetical protein
MPAGEKQIIIMRRFKFLLLFLSIVLVLGLNAETPVLTTPSDDFCDIRNTSFKNGEQLNYVVYYSIIGLYVNAGNATLTTNLERMNNRPVYHIIGAGKSNSSYNWISKVNNRYETFIDTGAMQPVKFIRDVHEGNHKKYENITFNRKASTAITNDGVYKVPDCVQDLVSCLYYARNINFNKYKPGDKISFSMFLDNEVYNMYIRYVGKEDVKTKYGKFRAIKFKPLLIKGTVFEGGEKMSVWVTDDANRVPLRVESSLAVGSIKVDMMGYKNLRYPMTSLKSLR